MIWKTTLQAEDLTDQRLKKDNYNVLFTNQWRCEFTISGKYGEVIDYEGHKLRIKGVNRQARVVTLEWWRKG